MSESKPKVSIIVPIYNVSNYIGECVISLINQSLHNIEIILIDDGSPDDSGAIIDRLAKEDSRVTVIHQQNRGVSYARNEGLRIARGEYIMFVDGDDYVESDYVSYFLGLIENKGCDIGVGKNSFVKNACDQEKEDEISIINGTDVIEGIYLNKFGVAVWNKIYKHSIITEHGLLFNTDYWYAEGMLFNIMYLQYVKDAAIGNRRVYHVRENPESATRKFSMESQFCGLRSMEYQKNHWMVQTQGIKTAWEYHYRMYAKHILQGLIATEGKRANRTLFRKCIRVLRTHLRIPLQADISVRMKENSFLMAVCPTGFIRDEIGMVHPKGDQTDYISRKLLSFSRQILNRMPEAHKMRIAGKMSCYFNQHYKPTYLDRSLL